MAQESEKGFELPNSTVALLLVLTIVFMVWSFAVVTTSLSSPGAAPLTGQDSGPGRAALGFFLGERPSAHNPIESGTARLTLVPPQGEAQ